MTFDKQIMIQRLNADGEFADWQTCHARVNRAGGGERDAGGARRSTMMLTFDLRWRHSFDPIFLCLQDFRIVYRGAVFVLTDYDDYMEQHRILRLEGESVGERQRFDS